MPHADQYKQSVSVFVDSRIIITIYILLLMESFSLHLVLGEQDVSGWIDLVLHPRASRCSTVHFPVHWDVNHLFALTGWRGTPSY